MMTFLGVPILDWVLLVVLLGFGVEAWMTCRTTEDDKKDSIESPAGRPAVMESSAERAREPTSH